VFPFLKYFFDPPEKIYPYSENLQVFDFNHTISFSYYDDPDNTFYLRLDFYNTMHGIFPKKDIIGRPLKYEYYDSKCQRLLRAIYLDPKLVVRKRNIQESHTIYRIIRHLRKENPIIREYMNLYMPILQYATQNRKLLFSKNFYSYILKMLKEQWVYQLDFMYMRNLKKQDLIYINKAIAAAFYIFYHDARVLNQKIDAFNWRIQKWVISRKTYQGFKQVPMDILGYSILRQKLRTKMTIIAICSLLQIKEHLLKHH